MDVKFTCGRNITVCNIPAYGTSSVAQMVFAHLLNLVQQHQPGALINEAALADALNMEKIAGAELGVLSKKPKIADNPL